MLGNTRGINGLLAQGLGGAFVLEILLSTSPSGLSQKGKMKTKNKKLRMNSTES
jgi:hypothetical protein